jgi:integrase/recombinase XerD
MPAHHLLEHYLDAYVTAAGIGSDKSAPLFRTRGGRVRKRFGEARIARQDARRMIVRRALTAGISRASGATRSGRPGSPSICSTAACSNTPSKWRRVRARATTLSDRRNDQVTLDKVERIVL